MAVLSHHPDIRVLGVQAKYADAAVRSLEAGRRVAVEECRTVADGIAVGELGERPWEVMRRFGVPVLRLEDDWIRSTITALCQTAKLVVEAAGAASAAGVLFCRDDVCRGRRIVAVLSGANITMESFTETLRSHPKVPGVGYP
jgi:threonine dehydratase